MFREFHLSSLKLTVALAVLAMLFVTACAVATQDAQRPMRNEGYVYIYLTIPRRSAVDVSFTIQEIRVLNSEGEWVNVPADRSVDSADIGQGQVLLWEGWLAQGAYSRLAWRISQGAMVREGKRTTLALPQPGGLHEMPIDFSVQERDANALFVTWEPERSVRDSYLLAPRTSVESQSLKMRSLSLYVTQEKANAVSVIDKHEGRVVGVVGVGRRPMGVVAVPARKRVYTANYDDKGLSVIDAFSNRVVDTIDTFGYAPQDMVVTDNAAYLAATVPDDDVVVVVDLAVNQFEQAIQVGNGPSGIAYWSGKNRAYVANAISHSISVIDMDSLEVINEIQIDFSPLGLAVNNDSLFVTNALSGGVNVYSLPSCELLREIFSKQSSHVESVSEKIIIATGGRNKIISYINTFLNSVSAEVKTDGRPGNVSYDDDRSSIYVIDEENNIVQELGYMRKNIIGKIHVGRWAYDVSSYNE